MQSRRCSLTRINTLASMPFALAACDLDESQQALRRALLDHSPLVVKAAEEALAKLSAVHGNEAHPASPLSERIADSGRTITMNLLLSAIAIGGNKAAAFSIWQMHLRLHWVAIGMLTATVVTWLIFRWRSAPETTAQFAATIVAGSVSTPPHRLGGTQPAPLCCAQAKGAKPCPIFPGVESLATDDRDGAIEQHTPSPDRFAGQAARLLTRPSIG